MTEPLLTMFEQAEKEQWAFSRTLDALQENGVLRCEIYVASYNCIYYKGLGKTWNRPIPREFIAPAIDRTFNQELLLNAIEKRKNHQSSYIQFLYDLAAAGVYRYIVKIEDRTVTYYGIDSMCFYAQHIPVSQ